MIVGSVSIQGKLSFDLNHLFILSFLLVFLDDRFLDRLSVVETVAIRVSVEVVAALC